MPINPDESTVIGNVLGEILLQEESNCIPDGSGDLIVDKDFNVSMVERHIDYLNRGPSLALLCLLEYCVLVGKEPISKVKEVSEDMESEDGNDDDCNEDIADVDSFHSRLNAEIDDIPVQQQGRKEANSLLDLVSKLKRGRIANARESFLTDHPQWKSHQQYLYSFIKIPMMIGPYVPKFPGKNPIALKTGVSELQKDKSLLWHKQSADFASFILTMLATWDTVSGLPHYPLNWSGLEEWVNDVHQVHVSEGPSCHGVWV